MSAVRYVYLPILLLKSSNCYFLSLKSLQILKQCEISELLNMKIGRKVITKMRILMNMVSMMITNHLHMDDIPDRTHRTKWDIVMMTLTLYLMGIHQHTGT